MGAPITKTNAQREEAREETVDSRVERVGARQAARQGRHGARADGRPRLVGKPKAMGKGAPQLRNAMAVADRTFSGFVFKRLV